jgi:hypothetical protein
MRREDIRCNKYSALFGWPITSRLLAAVSAIEQSSADSHKCATLAQRERLANR